MPATLRSFRLCCLVALFCLSSVIAIHAQSTEPELRAKLMGRPLYLLGFWSGNKLHFDSTGQFEGNPGLFRSPSAALM